MFIAGYLPNFKLFKAKFSLLGGTSWLPYETYSEIPIVKLELHERVHNQAKGLNYYRQIIDPNTVDNESWYDFNQKIAITINSKQFYRQICKEFLPKTKKADESKKKRLEISSNNQLEKSIKIEFRHLVCL